MKQKNLKQLSVVIQEEINRGEISGAAIRVLRNNEIKYQDELGLADIEKNIPVAKNTIYRMFSQSKPVTAVAASCMNAAS